MVSLKTSLGLNSLQSFWNESSAYRRNDERNPTHGDKHGGWKVDTQNEWSDGSGQFYFETVNTVVT